MLDAAKVDGLPEMLEASGLPHCCLYANQDGLEAVAPWLVELAADSSFTRTIFTQGHAPWTMWDRDAGVILRSPLALDALRRHLRRFTMVKIDGEKEPLFFRFWEPRVMCRYLTSHHAQARTNVLALLHGGAMMAVDRWNTRVVRGTAAAPVDTPPRMATSAR